MAPPPPPQVRLDKWLWHARFFRSRTLAAGQVEAGAVRVNGLRVVKPARLVGPGDVLTFVQTGQVRVVRVLDPGLRRGPAAEAQRLYLDLAPPRDPAQGAAVAGRLE